MEVLKIIVGIEFRLLSVSQKHNLENSLKQELQNISDAGAPHGLVFYSSLGSGDVFGNIYQEIPSFSTNTISAQILDITFHLDPLHLVSFTNFPPYISSKCFYLFFFSFFFA